MPERGLRLTLNQLLFDKQLLLGNRHPDARMRCIVLTWVLRDEIAVVPEARPAIVIQIICDRKAAR